MIFQANHDATLMTGSPAILTEFVTLSAAANIFRFDYQFQTQADGLLSVYFDGNLVFETDSQSLLDKSIVSTSDDVFLGATADPGVHTLIFRLDPDGADQAQANISNVQFGFADLEPVPEPATWLLTTVGALIACALRWTPIVGQLWGFNKVWRTETSGP